MASDLRSRLFIGLAVAGAKLKSCDHSWIRSWAGSLYAGAVVSARKNKLIELHVFPKMACTLNSIRSWYKWRFWVTFRRLNIKEQKIAHHFNRNDEIPHLYLSLWLPFNSTLAQNKSIFFFFGAWSCYHRLSFRMALGRAVCFVLACTVFYPFWWPVLHPPNSVLPTPSC